MLLGPGVMWLILPLVTQPLLPDGKLFLAQSLSLSVPLLLQRSPYRRCLGDVYWM